MQREARLCEIRKELERLTGEQLDELIRILELLETDPEAAQREIARMTGI